MQTSEQWLTHVKTLIDSLDLVSPDLLPGSFHNDILGPLSQERTMAESLGRELDALALLRKLSELGRSAEARGWFFWEKAAGELGNYVRADLCSFFRLGTGGVMHKIHPLESEEDAEEMSWPTGEKGPLTAISEADFSQSWLLQIGSRERFPVIARLQSTRPLPPISRAALDELITLDNLLYAVLARHFPSLEPAGVMDVVAIDPNHEQTSNIYGRDPGLLASVAAAEQAAQSDASVYFRGESGTGKELFAKHVHRLSSRGKGPFIPINCSAIPHELIESEMFGHEKGAFTGAYYRKIGKVEQANGGTLFLDEIGEMPLPFQAKLLRFLQEKKFTRVGGNNPVHSDARIVVATHRDLKEMVTVRSFREDLYYRINVIPINIPPLRDRGRDIRFLSELFFSKFISKSRASRRKVDETVFDVLERYHYPGNVRELENIVQRTVVMTQKQVIATEDLPPELYKGHEGELDHAFRLHPFEKFDHFLPQDRETLKILKKEVDLVAFSYQRDLDRRFLLHLLEQAGGSARKAAELAAINRTLFYKLLKRAGLDIGLLNKDES